MSFRFAYAFSGGDKKKFIPVLRRGNWMDAAPTWLLGRARITLTGEPYSESEYERLLRTLLGEREEAPPLGPSREFRDRFVSQATSTEAPENLVADAANARHESRAKTANLQNTDVLNDFLAVVKDQRMLMGKIAGAAAISGPVLNFATGLGPPGLSIYAVSLLTATTELISLMLVYQLLATRIKTIAIRKLERVFVYEIIGLAVVLLVYLCLFQGFTFFNPDLQRLEAKGLWKRAGLREALAMPMPAKIQGGNDKTTEFDTSTPDYKLLYIVGYEANQVWEEWTIHLVEIVLGVFWLTFFGLLAGSLSTFVVLRRQECLREAP